MKRILEEERTRHEAERQQYAASGQRPDPATMKTIMAAARHGARERTARMCSHADQLTKFKAMAGRAPRTHAQWATARRAARAVIGLTETIPCVRS